MLTFVIVIEVKVVWNAVTKNNRATLAILLKDKLINGLNHDSPMEAIKLENLSFNKNCLLINYRIWMNMRHGIENWKN